MLPGKSDSYPSFDGCVTANQQLAAKDFDFAGGKLGIWLNDFPYQDNVAGEAGQNPKWKLELLESVCPPEIVLE